MMYACDNPKCVFHVPVPGKGADGASVSKAGVMGLKKVVKNDYVPNQVILDHQQIYMKVDIEVSLSPNTFCITRTVTSKPLLMKCEGVEVEGRFCEVCYEMYELLGAGAGTVAPTGIQDGDEQISSDVFKEFLQVPENDPSVKLYDGPNLDDLAEYIAGKNKAHQKIAMIDSVQALGESFKHMASKVDDASAAMLKLKSDKSLMALLQGKNKKPALTEPLEEKKALKDMPSGGSPDWPDGQDPNSFAKWKAAQVAQAFGADDSDALIYLMQSGMTAKEAQEFLAITKANAEEVFLHGTAGEVSNKVLKQQANSIFKKMIAEYPYDLKPMKNDSGTQAYKPDNPNKKMPFPKNIKK